MDIARIWKLHSFENISPYTYGLSLFIIGSILASELVNVFQRAAQTAEAESQAKQSKRQAEFSRQLGHDIRSPLAALNMIVTVLTEVPEDQRLIIRNSAQRINDIANSLLDRKWSTPEKAANAQVEMSEFVTAPADQTVMLSSLVDSIVSEKRVQYRERQDVNIEVDLTASYGLFSIIGASDLARALSNLIDNSVKATSESSGYISISVGSNANFNRIVVNDNGRGISPEVLNRLGPSGASFGEHAGWGLGLHQAKIAIESAGGEITISSELGKGTSIVISIPKSQPPTWFMSQLTVSSGTQLISIDDDQTVHQIWDRRLRSIDGKSLKHRAFTSVEQFEDWYSANTSTHSQFLVDFEFLGHAESGLQMIERLNIASQAILVSSRAEDPYIQTRAKALGLKLLPKALAPLIPIEVTPL